MTDIMVYVKHELGFNNNTYPIRTANKGAVGWKLTTEMVTLDFTKGVIITGHGITFEDAIVDVQSNIKAELDKILENRKEKQQSEDKLESWVREKVDNFTPTDPIKE